MKVILKSTSPMVTSETMRMVQNRVIEELNDTGVAIVPHWCEVIDVEHFVEVKTSEEGKQ